MKGINYAISLGSSFTCIYKYGVGVVLCDRSVVLTGLKGKKEIALRVGKEAIDSGMDYRDVISNGEVDFTLAQLCLSKYFKDAEITKKDGVVFLISMEDMKIASEYKNLAYSLGVNKVEVIPSIMASAYGFEIETFNKSYLIVDIGVNTEIGIISYGRLLTGATVLYGGANIDKKIAEYIYNNKGIEISRESAEKIKNEIATLLPNDDREISIYGFIKDTTEHVSLKVSSSEIFGVVVEEYSLIADAIMQVLSPCDSGVIEDIKRHGIYLCGMSSKMTGIEKFLKVKTGLESFRYKPEIITMVGAGNILDDPNAIDRIMLA